MAGRGHEEVPFFGGTSGLSLAIVSTSDDAVNERAMPPVWSRAYMRRVRSGLADDGVDRCPFCRRDAHGQMPGSPPPTADANGIRFDAPAGRHALDWMSINPQPALVWHGSPVDGEHHMFLSTYCRWCYAVTLMDSGSVWSEDHPDLTRLTDEEQILRDGK